MEYSKFDNFCGDSVTRVCGDEVDVDEDKLTVLELNGTFGGNELILSRVFKLGSSVAFPLCGRPEHRRST